MPGQWRRPLCRQLQGRPTSRFVILQDSRMVFWSRQVEHKLNCAKPTKTPLSEKLLGLEGLDSLWATICGW